MDKERQVEYEEVQIPEGVKSFICLPHFKKALEPCATKACLEKLNPHCEFAERFTSLLIDYFLRSQAVWDQCRGKMSEIPAAMNAVSPYCCHIGEEKLEVIYTLARDRGFGRSGAPRIAWISTEENPRQHMTAQISQFPLTKPRDVM